MLSLIYVNLHPNDFDRWGEWISGCHRLYEKYLVLKKIFFIFFIYIFLIGNNRLYVIYIFLF